MCASMSRKKVSKELELKYRIYTRVNSRKYQELKALLQKNSTNDMSSLIRDIIYNKPIKIITKDQTFDNLMEELSKLRTEIRAIGVNINQITRLFNTYPETTRKVFYARMAFKEYLAIQPKIDELITLISKLAKKWLSE